MPQYWIQTPVENAKEVVQRYLDANSGTLTGYAGATVSYDEHCEVVFYDSDLSTLPTDSSIIYFGTFIKTDDTSLQTLIGINDGNDTIITFDNYSALNSGHYKYIIWNWSEGFINGLQYFIGYKFNITTP